MYMTAERLIKENTRFDRGGSPLEVTIPYEQFIDFIEEYGLDFTEEERKEIHQARADHEVGNKDSFTSLEAFKKSLECTK